MCAALNMIATRPQIIATLEPVRFGEFLRDRNLISDEQWLAALERGEPSPHRRDDHHEWIPVGRRRRGRGPRVSR